MSNGDIPKELKNGQMVPVVAFPMDATVSETPPQITLKIYSAPTPNGGYTTDLSGTYDIFRRSPDAVNWGTKIATVTVGTTIATWTDTNVQVGQLYEYGLAPTGTSDMGYGYIVAGIKADQTQPKGRLALVVANDVIANLPTEYAQFKSDLVADGWVVHEIPVARAPDYMSNGTGPNDSFGVPTAPFPTAHIAIRHAIQDLWKDAGNQYPGLPLKNVILLGKVPVCRSGHIGVAPDGHANQAAVGADAYYADMDGDWESRDIITNEIMLVGGTVIPSTCYSVTTGTDGLKHFAFGPTTMTVSNADAWIPFVDMALQNPDPTPSVTSIYPYRVTVTSGTVTSVASTTTDTSITVAFGTVNVPGDNKWDPEYMSQLLPNTSVELGFGRIDLSNSIPGEYEALRMYFNKDHRYKTATLDFQPGRKAIARLNDFAIITIGCLESMPSALGMKNLVLIGPSDLPAIPNANFDGDSAYTAQHPCLFYFKGDGTPAYSDGGKAVFWTGMQSHWGWWSSTSVSSSQNAMQRRLAEDNFALSFTWSIGVGQLSTSYLYHRMGMGYDTGDMMRISISNRGGPSPTYRPAQTPLMMDHMGDPTLRLFMFPPPTGLSVAKSGNTPSLTWTAAPAPPTGEPQVIGYHVYRGASADGPFTRLTSAPVAGTTYVDPSVTSGTWNYMVRAVRLETTGGGTFYNASLGVRQSIDLTNAPTPVQISTASLPGSNWKTPYQATLAAQGGTPVYAWTVLSGALPPGLALSSGGIISGTSTAGGVYSFTVQATDYLGQTAQKSLSITADSDNTTTFYAEAGQYVKSTSAGAFYDPYMLVAGPGSTYNYESFLRFDISSLQTNNAFVRAKLILSFHETTNTISLLKAALTQDAGDNWDEFNFNWSKRPADDTTVPPSIATTFPAPFGTMELDVTQMVQATLAKDPAKKVSMRLFTGTPSSFGNEVRISTRYSSGNARPRLVIETTDAPAITITSPTVNPAAIYPGSALQINATATAIPARAGSLTTQWTKVSGSGTVVFSPPTQASTGATFSAPGDYVLRLSVDDGVLQSSKDVTVRVLPLPPAGTATVTGPTNGLVLRLPFDETSGTVAKDVSGVTPANSGTFAYAGTSSNPSWSSTGGRIGGALSLSGSGQRVDVPDSSTNPFDGGSQISISFWMYANAFDNGNYRAVLSKRTSVSANQSYCIYLSPSLTPALYVDLGVYQSSNNNRIISGGAFAAQQWYHVVVVFDGTLPATANRFQLYINASPNRMQTTTLSSVPRCPASALRIGTYDASDTKGFNGLIDEVRIYNRALSLAEIQDLYGAAPSNMGPVITTSSAVTGSAGQPISLAATVTDDGLPGLTTLGWSTLSGPGSMVFGNPMAASTTATPPLAGGYLLRLTANDGAIATWANVTANVTGPTISDWRWKYFGTTDDSGDAADSANPSGDGVRNLVKYALGLDPAKSYSGSQALPCAQRQTLNGTDYLTYTFTRPTTATDVTYAIEAASDLSGSWTSIDPLNATNQVSVLADTPTVGIQTITVKDTQPIGTSPRRFMRLRVTRP